MKLTKIAFFIILLLFLFVASIIVNGFLQVKLSSMIMLIKDRAFLSALLFGIETSAFATILSALFGIPAGFYLARNNSMFSKFMDTFFDIPLSIPPLIVGVLLLGFFNLKFVERFYSFMFTVQGAVCAQFFIAFPFTVKASKNAFELIPPIYERIAMTLGASNFKSFFDTTFKLAFNGILSGLILTWLRSLGEFGATLMVGGGIAYKTANIPINIYLNMTEGDFDKGLAASIIVVSLSFVAVVVVKCLFRKKGKLF